MTQALRAIFAILVQEAGVPANERDHFLGQIIHGSYTYGDLTLSWVPMVRTFASGDYPYPGFSMTSPDGLLAKRIKLRINLIVNVAYFPGGYATKEHSIHTDRRA